MPGIKSNSLRSRPALISDPKLRSGQAVMGEVRMTQSMVAGTCNSDQLQTKDSVRRHVIDALRSRRMSLKTALRPLVDEQARMLVSEFGPDAPAVDRILRSQSAVLNLLSDRYDALDEAIHHSEIPFVELGCDGRVMYRGGRARSKT